MFFYPAPQYSPPSLLLTPPSPPPSFSLSFFHWLPVFWSFFVVAALFHVCLKPFKLKFTGSSQRRKQTHAKHTHRHNQAHIINITIHLEAFLCALCWHLKTFSTLLRIVCERCVICFRYIFSQSIHISSKTRSCTLHKLYDYIFFSHNLVCARSMCTLHHKSV